VVSSDGDRLLTETPTEGDYNQAGQDIQRDENSVGNTFDRGVSDVENAPRKQPTILRFILETNHPPGDAEQDVRQDVDRDVNDVESAPERIAGKIGGLFGGAEREGRMC